ncbi:MAG: hypothetical protein WD398_05080 [Cyclobacteriaceae bacterium]
MFYWPFWYGIKLKSIQLEEGLESRVISALQFVLQVKVKGRIAFMVIISHYLDGSRLVNQIGKEGHTIG